MEDFMRQFIEGITSDYFRREVLPYWVALAVLVALWAKTFRKD